MTESEVNAIRIETFAFIKRLATARIHAGDDPCALVQIVDWVGVPCVASLEPATDSYRPVFKLSELAK